LLITKFEQILIRLFKDLGTGVPNKTQIALIASHDQLQMQLVPLCNLLQHTLALARKRALRSATYFFSTYCALFFSWNSSLRVGSVLTLRVNRLLVRWSYPWLWPAVYRSRNTTSILSGCLAVSSAYAAYGASMWYLVLLKSREAELVKRQLDAGQLERQGETRLGGRGWEWAESYAGSLQDVAYYR